MKILVDADAIPKALKEILIKVANRTKSKTIFISGIATRLPIGEFITAISAGNAFDAADDLIIEKTEKNDLVITADIILADRAINLGAEVLNFKGYFFTPQNIKTALGMRDFLEEMRNAGEIGGGNPPFSEKIKEKFTNSLNKFLQKKRNL